MNQVISSDIMPFKKRRVFFCQSIHIKKFYPLVNDVGKSLTAVNLNNESLAK